MFSNGGALKPRAPTSCRITVRIAGTVAKQFGEITVSKNQLTICKLLRSRQRQILEYYDTYPATKNGVGTNWPAGTIVLLEDDVDGSKADETIEFGIDGTTYVIDISESNAQKLRGALDGYISKAAR
jgi:hypothetical protein